MSDGKVVIKIDATDWARAFSEQEPTIESEADVIALAMGGMETGQIAKLILGGRAQHVVPVDIIKPDKLLLYGGARADVAQILVRQERDVTLQNGKTITIRDYLGRPGRPMDESDDEDTADGDDDGPPWIVSGSPEAVERARRYLERTIPGHIYTRLMQIAAGGGDVLSAVAELKATLDEMASRLTEPTTQ
jgi:hypothetical protein